MTIYQCLCRCGIYFFYLRPLKQGLEGLLKSLFTTNTLWWLVLVVQQPATEPQLRQAGAAMKPDEDLHVQEPFMRIFPPPKLKTSHEGDIKAGQSAGSQRPDQSPSSASVLMTLTDLNSTLSPHEPFVVLLSF